MKFITGGNLRNYLKSNVLSWRNKIYTLCTISKGIKYLHDEAGLVHQDFHIGNILAFSKKSCIITDLGLCKPANENGISEDGENIIFGVIPYVAPEVLSFSSGYTKASDIYGFAMIIFTRIPPFHNIPHDRDLVLRICNGYRYRPEISSKIVIPKLLVQYGTG